MAKTIVLGILTLPVLFVVYIVIIGGIALLNQRLDLGIPAQVIEIGAIVFFFGLVSLLFRLLLSEDDDEKKKPPKIIKSH